MVVQCPTCQSKFRVADDKVTDRGVRVRCTSCRNVFPVRKEPAAAPRAQPSPAAQQPALQRPVQAAGLPEPARLDVDDLFGMSELTGDAPLADMAKALEREPTSPLRPITKPLPNFDDLDIDIDEEPPPAPAATRPPTGPQRANGLSTAVTVKPPPPPPDAQAPEPVADEFAGLELAEPAKVALDVPPAAETRAPEPQPQRTAPEPPAPPVAEAAQVKSLVSSALTGLLGAALAIAVLVVGALSGDANADWLRFRASEDVVAASVVSGLYDTAGGKPVFFVRGKVENRGAKVHGPVRVTAELMADDASPLEASAIAGAEPTPEDVYGLRSDVDVARLHHALETSRGERKLQPGASLPFFVVIADPPADLARHRLRLKVEPVDAWVPPAPGKTAR